MDSTTQSGAETEQQKVIGILGGFRFGMLVTHAPDGELRARPMAIAKVEPDGAIWFLSGKETAKVHEIAVDTRVAVICQDDRSAYVTIQGLASLEESPSRIHELWKESYQVWFPEGEKDPNLILIRVDPSEAEYWDQRGANKLRYLFESAKALAFRKRPEIREGDQHGTVRM